MCHFVNQSNGHHMLLVCDVKNHCLREVDMNDKTVRKVAGVVGKRGHDRMGGNTDANSQEIASPWDIMPYHEEGKYIIAMAGPH